MSNDEELLRLCEEEEGYIQQWRNSLSEEQINNI